MNKELAREILSGYLALNELPSDDIVVWTDFDKAYTFVGLVCIAYGLRKNEKKFSISMDEFLMREFKAIYKNRK